jgi:Family of unknown function (DUF5343)
MVKDKEDNMTTEKMENLRTPAYASYESFNTLLDRMKEALPLPRPIDSTFWLKMKFSGSTTSALKSTLIFIGLLTEENMPTDELEELAKTDKDNRGTMYGHILDRAYAKIFTKLDLERATSGQLKTEFKNMGADGQVGQKAMSFFLSMAKDAGKKMHPHLTTRQPHAPGLKKVTAKHLDEQSANNNEEQKEKTDENIGKISTLIPSIHPAIAGLLQVLPTQEKGWTEVEKTKFKTAFEALLDVVYPIKPENINK